MNVSSANISVIIPVYNGKKYLRSAINSVISQTLPPVELIIIDDGSSDNSIELIKDVKANFSIHIHRQNNSGQSFARNHGARIATGDYLAFLDQDDIWYPKHLEKLIQPFLINDQLGWVYSNLDEIDEDGQLIQLGILNITRAKHPKIRLVDMIGEDVFILPSASLILKKAFHEIGGFDERLVGYEDDDLFTRLFAAGWGNAYIPESLSKWRIYSDSSSHSERMDLSRMIYAKKLLERYPDKPKLNRFWSNEIIIPRFIRNTIHTYFFYCVKLNDYNRCYSLLKQLSEYTSMLSKKHQKKWHLMRLLLKYPRVCNMLWKKIIFHLPKPCKRVIQKCFS